MTKLEQKLIELGYECVSYEYMSKLERYEKVINNSVIYFYIRGEEIVMHSVYLRRHQTQYETAFLQVAIDILQKDLEELKEYEVSKKI